MGKNKEIRKKIFLDTNIIVSGLFFKGREAELLSIPDVLFYSCDVVIEELKEVVNKKFKSLRIENKKIALLELEHSLIDFVILKEYEYAHNIVEAKKLIRKEKDAKILAAVLTITPDCFITGDVDFYTREIQRLVSVSRTVDILQILRA